MEYHLYHVYHSICEHHPIIVIIPKREKVNLNLTWARHCSRVLLLERERELLTYNKLYSAGGGSQMYIININQRLREDSFVGFQYM